jgi:DNA primase
VEQADFPDEKHARLFSLLRERAGRDLDGVLSDERARPLMGEIAALSTAAERLYPSEAAIREAWLRLAILSRQRAKRETPDFDAKERLQSEIRALREALQAVTAEP